MDDVYGYFQNLAFEPDRIDAALDRALNGNFIDQLPPSGQPRALRLTTIGAYAHHTLAGEFQYLDVIVTDTPVVDPATRDTLKLVRSIRPRLERAEAFISYLDSAWADSGLADTRLFNWSAHATSARSEMQDIARRL